MTKTAIVKTVQSRRRLIRNIVLIVLGLGACAGILYIGFMLLVALAFSGPDDLFGNPKTCEPSNVEGIAHIKLPSSARDVKSGCGGLQGVWAEAAFDMNPSDLAVFVNSTNVKLPLSTIGKPKRLECSFCLNLTNPKSYLYGTHDEPEWFEEIFIDTSNPSLYRVYFTLLAG